MARSFTGSLKVAPRQLKTSASAVKLKWTLIVFRCWRISLPEGVWLVTWTRPTEPPGVSGKPTFPVTPEKILRTVGLALANVRLLAAFVATFRLRGR